MTTKNILFSGWPEFRLLVPLHHIATIEKTNSLVIIPNALLITNISGEEYFFGSFMERDLCYTLLKSMVEVSKCLVEIMDPNDNKVFETPTKSESTEKQIIEHDNALKNTVNSISSLFDKLDLDEKLGEDIEAVDESVSSEEEDMSLIPSINFESALRSDGMHELHTFELPFKSRDVWKYCWSNISSFRFDFKTISQAI